MQHSPSAVQVTTQELNKKLPSYNNFTQVELAVTAAHTITPSDDALLPLGLHPSMPFLLVSSIQSFSNMLI